MPASFLTDIPNRLFELRQELGKSKQYSSFHFIIISSYTVMGVYLEELIVAAVDTVDLMRLLFASLWRKIVSSGSGCWLVFCLGDSLINFPIAVYPHVKAGLKINPTHHTTAEFSLSSLPLTLNTEIMTTLPQHGISPVINSSSA